MTKMKTCDFIVENVGTSCNIGEHCWLVTLDERPSLEFSLSKTDVLHQGRLTELRETEDPLTDRNFEFWTAYCFSKIYHPNKNCNDFESQSYLGTT